jgi:virginiamycin A acetyltransferase
MSDNFSVIDNYPAPEDARDLRRSAWSSVLLSLAEQRRFRSRVLRAGLRLESGEFFSATARAIMRRHYGVSIGAYSYGACFQPGAFNPGVTIGRYVSIGPEVLVYRRNHPVEHLSTHPFFYNTKLGHVQEELLPFKPLEIGADAWIGARTIVTPGCSRIGIGSIVGAGSILTRNVPDFTVVGGAPARVIRQRFSDEICQRILATQWWLRPMAECVAIMKDMIRPLGADFAQHPLLNQKPADL